MQTSEALQAFEVLPLLHHSFEYDEWSYGFQKSSLKVIAGQHRSIEGQKGSPVESGVPPV